VPLSREQLETTEVWLVRHAESVGNQARVFQDTDTPLSERGHAQARHLAERLRRQSFAMLLSSTSTRATETANYVSEAVGLEIQEDERLREIDLGAWVGLSRREVAERYPEEWAAFRRRDPDFHYGSGESLAEMQRRMVSTIEEVTKQCFGQRVVVISSQGAIRVYLAYVLGLPLGERSRLGVDNAGITRVRSFQTRPNRVGSLPGILLSLNDKSHLEGYSEV